MNAHDALVYVGVRACLCVRVAAVCWCGWQTFAGQTNSMSNLTIDCMMGLHPSVDSVTRAGVFKRLFSELYMTYAWNERFNLVVMCIHHDCDGLRKSEL